ncbi:DUF3258 domain-containing protein [Acidianus ambivalens]|uniref:Uncharacterized protein n=1 Tax=Acidianus ambivalens TaxID=2283 RepID=A0A650CUF0_ACIAM|nr:DUF3258 domain-containing protein [Acidianus ambivalens]MQL56440.1 hypothetical protein [Acidianus ambivalens]QGR21077.1 hypothetical protein D1866_02850 [Acidianus ambivalens]
MNAIDYAVTSKHLTSTVVHELLFSTKQMRFIKPIRSDKGLGKLYYKLLDGHYLKFCLYGNKNDVTLKIKLVDIENGEPNENTVFEITADWSIIDQILSDQNAPRILTDFLNMMPAFHGVSRVADTKYEYKNSYEIVWTIRDYIQAKVVQE